MFLAEFIVPIGTVNSRLVMMVALCAVLNSLLRHEILALDFA